MLVRDYELPRVMRRSWARKAGAKMRSSPRVVRRSWAREAGAKMRSSLRVGGAGKPSATEAKELASQSQFFLQCFNSVILRPLPLMQKRYLDNQSRSVIFVHEIVSSMDYLRRQMGKRLRRARWKNGAYWALGKHILTSSSCFPLSSSVRNPSLVTL